MALACVKRRPQGSADSTHESLKTAWGSADLARSWGYFKNLTGTEQKPCRGRSYIHALFEEFLGYNPGCLIPEALTPTEIVRKWL